MSYYHYQVNDGPYIEPAKLVRGLREIVRKTTNVIQYTPDRFYLNLERKGGQIEYSLSPRILSQIDLERMKYLYCVFNMATDAYLKSDGTPLDLEDWMGCKNLYLYVEYTKDSLNYVLGRHGKSGGVRGFVTWDELQNNEDKLNYLGTFISMIDAAYENLPSRLREYGKENTLDAALGEFRLNGRLG